MIKQRLFLYLFVDVYGILGMRFIPPIFIKGARVAAPSVCFGPWCGPRILLTAAPTATPCFRRWRRSSPLRITSASGLTDSTRTVSPTKWKAPWERQLLGGFSFLVKPMESSHNPIFSICDSPQKSSAVRKVYRAGPSSYNLSVSLRSTAPLVGEPLAKPFTLRGLPKPPLGRGGGTAQAVTERFILVAATPSHP